MRSVLVLGPPGIEKTSVVQAARECPTIAVLDVDAQIRQIDPPLATHSGNRWDEFRCRSQGLICETASQAGGLLLVDIGAGSSPRSGCSNTANS